VFGPDVVLEPFVWEGSNTTQARLEAAEALRRRLESWRTSHPSTRIHVIAHSHAGNIAMYALRDVDVCAAISDLICLSTPFLHARPRELGERLATALEYVVRLGVAVLPLIIFALAMYVMTFGSAPLYVVVGGGAVAGIASLVLWTRLPQALRRLHAASHERAKAMWLPTGLTAPTLLIRDALDEASLALTAAQACSVLVTRVLRMLLRSIPTEWLRGVEETVVESDKQHSGVLLGLDRTPPDPLQPLRRVWPSVLLAVGVFVLAFASVATTAGLSAALEASVPLLFLVALTVANLAITGWGEVKFWWVLVLAPLCVWLALLVTALALAPFDIELAMFAVGLEMSTEATPPGVWELHQIGMPSSTLDERGLRHVTYENAEALQVLRLWLRERVEA